MEEVLGYISGSKTDRPEGMHTVTFTRKCRTVSKVDIPIDSGVNVL